MLALYRSNRQADALAACTRARFWLADDLGLDPGPELRELEQRILVHDPSLLRGTVSPSRRAARTPATTSIFAGRLGELTHLRQRLPQEFGSVTMVVGEPGIGKTRLVAELAEEATEAEMVVLWGRCPDGDWAAPYTPFVEGIERHLTSLPAETARRLIGDFAGPLADVLPIVSRLFPTLTAMRARDVDDRRFEIFDGFSRLLAEMAATAQLVVVIDDLHWADRATLALLSFLAVMTATSPIAIVGTYRDTEVTEMHPLAICLASIQRPVIGC